jgi:hypothetical protein
MSKLFSNQASDSGVLYTVTMQDITLISSMYGDSYVRLDWQILKNLNTNVQFQNKVFQERFYKGAEDAFSLEECDLKEVLRIVLDDFPSLKNKTHLTREDLVGLSTTLPLIEKVSERGKPYLAVKRSFPLIPEGDYQAESMKAELKTANSNKAYKKVLNITWKLLAEDPSHPLFIFQSFYFGFADSFKEKATSFMFSSFCDKFDISSGFPIQEENFIGLQAKIKVKHEVYQEKIQAKIKKIVPLTKESSSKGKQTIHPSLRHVEPDCFMEDEVTF